MDYWLPLFVFTINTCMGQSAKRHFYEHLLQDYDKRMIPRVDGRPLLINLGFTLAQLQSLDEKNQILTSSGWFQLKWHDYRLGWNESLYNHTSVVIPSKELWLPDIGFLNSVSIYHSSMIKNEFRCIIHHNGSVLWVPGGTYHTTCELDISKFPFDKQQCYIQLTNWAYNIEEMNLTVAADGVFMGTYKPSAEWAITKTSITRDEIYYECCGNTSFPTVLFNIWIERKSLYYIVNIILPCIILSALANFTFCVPPDSGEKISLGITLLLSFTVFQLIVAESIPRRSDSVPLISLYISVIIGVVTASLICAIFISQLHHRGPVPLPRVLRVIIFDVLARLMCLSSLRVTHGTIVLRPNSQRSECSQIRSLSETSLRLRLLNGKSNTEEIVSDSKLGDSRTDTPESTMNSKVLQDINNKLGQIVRHLEDYERQKTEEDTTNFMRQEWQAIGKVLDRFFFVLYVLITLVITIRFLMPASLFHQEIGIFGAKNN